MAPIWSPARLIASGLMMLALWTSAANAASAGDYFVHSLPGAPSDSLVKMHAGHIEVTPEHNGNLFFWHFENQHIADRQRTVIWLNGGPGCSSEDGVLMEIGPYRLQDDHTLVYNNGSWHEFANLLFVDNPVGTGFSFVDTDSYVHELDEMADQFVTFLGKWFELFPEYEHDDLYISGESFAGQHIPYIAKAILKRNAAAAAGTQWNLQGLLIGNGWISPKEQYEAYLSYGYEKGIVEKGTDIAASLEQQYRICEKEMAAYDSGEVNNAACEAVLQEMLRMTQTNDLECYNMYDVRLKDVYPSCGMNWPPDLEYVTPYLRRKDVIDALHISPNKNTGWTECNGNVGQQFRARKSVPAVQFLPELLTQMRILLFSGAEDLICNHLGTEAFIGNMEWNGGKGMEISPGNWAPRRDWTFEGESAGFWQEARNLSYVLFYNSSHMVPFDYPRRSRDMLDRFLGVDISTIGGEPSESLLDGEKLPDTTVGGATNSTESQADQALEEAKWAAYQRSGEVVLVIVVLFASVWGYWIWTSRRKSRTEGYGALASVAERSGSTGLEGFRNKRRDRDLEAGDFDESELDDLHVTSPTDEHERYSIGGASDDEDGPEKQKKPENGH